MTTEAEETMMIDIKLRNVKIENSEEAVFFIKIFMNNFSERRGISKGVAYSSYSSKHGPKFYVYRTDKTVVCVGQYKES